MAPSAWGRVRMPSAAAWVYMVGLVHMLDAGHEQVVGCISVFDGVERPGRMSNMLQAAGLPCFSMTRESNSLKQDVSQPEGVQHFLQLLALLAPNSLLWLAPPCNSWIFMSSSVHRRSPREPLGSPDAWVDYHNGLAEFTAMAILAATSVGSCLSCSTLISCARWS